MDKFEEVLPKLVQIQLFSDFCIDDENDCRILRQVYESMVLESYQKGDVIIEEGKYGDMFYILYTGKVHSVLAPSFTEQFVHSSFLYTCH